MTDLGSYVAWNSKVELIFNLVRGGGVGRALLFWVKTSMLSLCYGFQLLIVLHRVSLRTGPGLVKAGSKKIQVKCKIWIQIWKLKKQRLDARKILEYIFEKMLLNKRTKRSKPGLKFNPMARLALIGQEDLKRVRKVPQTWYSGFQNACFIRFATG